MTNAKDNITKGELSAFFLEQLKELLREPDLNPEDDLISMGGSSMTAIALADRIFQTYGVEMMVYELMGSPFIESWVELAYARLD